VKKKPSTIFKVARKSTITQKIIDQIRTAILEGRLKPGDKLPSEKDMVEQFQVSKQTLRESLRALEHMGLIDVRNGIGGGAFVVEVDIEVIKGSLANFLYFKDLTIENLSELRKLIEPYAAKVAAQTISKKELKNLKKLNDTARENLNQDNITDVSRDEINFHRFIAEQTQNPLMILILDFIESLLEDFKNVLKPDTQFISSVLDSHEQIYQAISDKDPEKAAEEMLKHVTDVESHLIKLKKNQADVEMWNINLQKAG
jgi:GntR family transcriptional repressor for pyruvate dehydrogenase complex